MIFSLSIHTNFRSYIFQPEFLTISDFGRMYHKLIYNFRQGFFEDKELRRLFSKISFYSKNLQDPQGQIALKD